MVISYRDAAKMLEGTDHPRNESFGIKKDGFVRQDFFSPHPSVPAPAIVLVVRTEHELQAERHLKTAG